jgi:hypothetical protein
MPTFKKSTYLDSLKLISFSLSIDLDASLPQNGQYKTRLGTLVGNFGEPSGLTFHNLIRGPLYWTPHRIYGGNLILHHWPTWGINKKSK